MRKFTKPFLALEATEVNDVKKMMDNRLGNTTFRNSYQKDLNSTLLDDDIK